MKAFQLLVGMLIGGVLMFSSCRSKDADRLFLDRMEGLMAKRPDVALKWLNDSIQSDHLSGKNYADWCLLVTEAKEKCEQPHTADSLIRIACTYYEAYPEPERLMQSYYYMGRTSQGLGDALMAQNYYLKALKAGEASHDLSQKALICRHLGALYAGQEAFEEAITYIQKGLSWANEAADAALQSGLLCDLAKIYWDTGMLDSAAWYYKQAVQKAPIGTVFSVYRELGGVLTDAGYYREAYSYLQLSKQMMSNTPLPYDASALYLAMGKLLAQTGQPDSARYYLQEEMQGPVPAIQTAACFQLVQMARQAKDWPTYASLQEEYEQLCDSIQKQASIATAQRMQSLYTYQLNESQNQRLQLPSTQRNYYSIILLIAFIVTSFFAYYLWYKKTKETAQASLQPAVEQPPMETEEDFKRSTMYAKMSNPLKRSHNSSEKEVYIDTLSKIYPDLIRQIKQMHPGIKLHEINLCYYTRIGLGNQEMSNVLDCATNSICTKKTRLYEKIFHTKGTPEAFNQFIQSI